MQRRRHGRKRGGDDGTVELMHELRTADNDRDCEGIAAETCESLRATAQGSFKQDYLEQINAGRTRAAGRQAPDGGAPSKCLLTP